MTNELKASDLGFVEATYKPIAECEDVDCGWVCRDATAKDCRDHIIQTGHESVIRTRKTIGQYYRR